MAHHIPLFDDILAGITDIDDQYRELREAFCDALHLPTSAKVVGESVNVEEIHYSGTPRRGLITHCTRNGRHELSVADLVFSPGSMGAEMVDAYRHWLGIGPLMRAEPALSWTAELDLDRPIELVVVRPRSRAFRCRTVVGGHHITLRGSGDYVPGEVIEVQPSKQWDFKGHPYLSGEVLSQRVDVSTLGLQPLRLVTEMEWNPADQHWGDGPPPDWAQPIIARGARPSFEMEKVLPAADQDDDGPILRALDLHRRGAPDEARELFFEVLEQDLRCLDAHAYLGNWDLDLFPRRALRHFEVGVAIGEQAMGPNFDGVLEWGWLDNRPYLRCLHGQAQALWQLERWDEAEAVFERLLYLNPSDNLGARTVLPKIRSRISRARSSVT